MIIPDVNLETRTELAVVARYAKIEELQPCEAAIFQVWIKPEAAALDLGG